jgi:hypothetical protein
MIEAVIGDRACSPIAGAYGWDISHHNFLFIPIPTASIWALRDISQTIDILPDQVIRNHGADWRQCPAAACRC